MQYRHPQFLARLNIGQAAHSLPSHQIWASYATFSSLLQSCCEELQIISDCIYKLRKLPNIVIVFCVLSRKDKVGLHAPLKYRMTKRCIPAEGGTGTCCGPPDTSGFLLFPEVPGRPTKAATAVAILCTSSVERPAGGEG